MHLKENAPKQPLQQKSSLAGNQSAMPPAFQLKAEEKEQNKNATPVAQQKKPEGKDEKAPAPKDAVKTGDKTQDKVDPGYTTHVNKSVIVTVPSGGGTTYPTLVIYGGLSYATGKWMMSQVPSSLFQSHVLVFSNHSQDYAAATGPDHKEVLSKQGVSASSYAVIGFSKGGRTAYENKSGEAWRFIGLIDPDVNRYFKGWTAPILMNWDVWSDYAKNPKQDPRSLLHDSIQKGTFQGTSYQNKSVLHKGMPQDWFASFAGNL